MVEFKPVVIFPTDVASELRQRDKAESYWDYTEKQNGTNPKRKHCCFACVANQIVN